MGRRTVLVGMCCILPALSGCATIGPRAVTPAGWGLRRSTAAEQPLAGRVIPCPCTIDELERLPIDRPGVVIARDGSHATRNFHPGAARVYRIYDPDVDPVAGNQCAYDESDRLITDGPAAGTPDLVSPEVSKFGHFTRDILPFLRLGWREYHARGWAPVSDPSCPPSFAPPLP